MATRVGRPRSRVDNQEWIAVFARLPAEQRSWLMDVLEGIDTGLQAAEEPLAEKKKPAASRGEQHPLSIMDTPGGISNPVPGSLGTIGRHE